MEEVTELPLIIYLSLLIFFIKLLKSFKGSIIVIINPV